MSVATVRPLTASTRTGSCSTGRAGSTSSSTSSRPVDASALEPAFVVDRPEPRRLRAGRTRGDPHDLVGPACLVEPRAERVSGERQPFGRVRARPAVRRARTLAGRGRAVRRRGVRPPLARVEAPTRSQQLEAPERDVVGPNRDQQHVGGASPARRLVCTAAGTSSDDAFLRGQLLQRERRALELGRERLASVTRRLAPATGPSRRRRAPRPRRRPSPRQTASATA